MAFRPHGSDPGRSAAGWLATCLVVLGGSLGCLVIIFAGASDPVPGLVGFAGAFTCLLLLLWLLREKPKNEVRTQHMLWLFRREPPAPRTQYAVRRQPPSQQPAGHANRPPTADEVRQLKDDPHNWIPARGASRQRQPGAQTRSQGRNQPE